MTITAAEVTGVDAVNALVGVLGMVGVLGVLFAFGAFIVLIREQGKLKKAEARVEELAQVRAQLQERLGEQGEELQRLGRGGGLDAERQAKAFEQHTHLNELTCMKLEAELKWLTSQLDARGAGRQRDDAWMEYHELMVEKTKLEMDSLRLYVQEQRKRLASDEWGA